ncbi:hypothetical protein Ab1vBOLIVR5_gp153c [Agrobacterium phage OLIVR5]|uniref:Uncharacterized protein n=1 Tax=Agrobacterium phage OLIVR5 TaxID=2723773 RepID=A0A858MTQ9_9CAUD|nr:hypothetical protein KNU99_gp248 [Agrobacterium phage OLIVR5]QIW87801.1 hypothetical protein Ab1vBOLIVR5_gp153c [Agrobacterium phage OLIVR5]QIW88066.1 hypothetical protein Ab1vBOLIVR6_gp159c [Agrobacterium phage OLIVR6]
MRVPKGEKDLRLKLTFQSSCLVRASKLKPKKKEPKRMVREI